MGRRAAAIAAAATLTTAKPNLPMTGNISADRGFLSPSLARSSDSFAGELRTHMAAANTLLLLLRVKGGFLSL